MFLEPAIRFFLVFLKNVALNIICKISERDMFSIKHFRYMSPGLNIPRDVHYSFQPEYNFSRMSLKNYLI